MKVKKKKKTKGGSTGGTQRKALADAHGGGAPAVAGGPAWATKSIYWLLLLFS